MKRLTLNRISAASIRANRKTYISLAVGIVLAVFFATAVSVFCYGIFDSLQQHIRRMVGDTDCVIYDEPDLTDEQLRQSGLFLNLGRVVVLAAVKDSGVCLGYADDSGAQIINQGCREGRLPEKAGEVAIEKSALEKLRLEAGIGDTVTWKIQPVDGTEIERSFTIVGFLNEQSGNLNGENWYWSLGREMRWPSVIVSPEERFSDGRPAIHRVAEYAPLVNYTKVCEHHSLENAVVLAVSRAEGQVRSEDPADYDRSVFVGGMGMMLILGASLLLCTGIGIASAMESVLAAKTEEIGMLRAVGATRRQIRRIFGRDAWLLSAIALPLGFGLGLAAVWLLCRIQSEQMYFAAPIWLLLPVAVVSLVCVFLSSALPLWRASRQLPMGVLRDTAMLRRARAFKSRSSFPSTRLIAGRQLRLHPWRQVGAMLMVVASLLCAALVGEIVYDAVGELARSRPVAFKLYRTTYDRDEFAGQLMYHFADSKSKETLSDGDLAQLRATPYVEEASIEGECIVMLQLPDAALPSYLTGVGAAQGADAEAVLDAMGGRYLLREESDPAPSIDNDPASLEAWNSYAVYQKMRAAQDALSLSGKPVRMRLAVVDLENAAYSDCIVEGKVDLAALDAGEQLLVYAPTLYVKDTGDVEGQRYVATPDERLPGKLLATLENDWFYTGMTLELTQLLYNGDLSETESNYESFVYDFSQMERKDAAPTVGAVLTGMPISYPAEPCLLTTEKGAAAMGFELAHLNEVSIYLTGDVDMETERALEEQIGRIAMRGNMELRNGLQWWREEKESIRAVFLLFGGMMLLFFTVAVAMQVSGTSRRIRADARMIGTLRAVGADEKALLDIYRIPTLLTTAAGIVLAIALYIAVALWLHSYLVSVKANMTVVVGAMAVLGLLCALCCLAGLRVRLKTVLDRSIVENIRDL